MRRTAKGCASFTSWRARRESSRWRKICTSLNEFLAQHRASEKVDEKVNCAHTLCHEITPMRLTPSQALQMLRSDDLIGVGMEADAVRKRLHPGNVVTYQIDRNINYTNFCTEYCSFCAFY